MSWPTIWTASKPDELEALLLWENLSTMVTKNFFFFTFANPHIFICTHRLRFSNHCINSILFFFFFFSFFLFKNNRIQIGALALCGTLQTGPLSPLIVIFNGFIPFFLAHWEEYKNPLYFVSSLSWFLTSIVASSNRHFNHVLILGTINSPSEAEMGVIFVYLITFFVGNSSRIPFFA
jgi:hypothetical protein